MNQRVNQTRRTRAYHAPRREAAAAETRQAILRAAKEEFEELGWAATTMRSIAERAGVSPKTVAGLFGTKPALLEATLQAVTGGDPPNPDTSDVIRPETLVEVLGEPVSEMKRARDAATMLDLLSAMASEAHARAARLYAAAETAAKSDERLAELWARVTEATLFTIRRWAEILLEKPGVRADLTLREAEQTLLLACHWNTYRTLTMMGGMRPEEFQAWAQYYWRRMLLA